MRKTQTKIKKPPSRGTTEVKKTEIRKVTMKSSTVITAKNQAISKPSTAITKSETKKMRKTKDLNNDSEEPPKFIENEEEKINPSKEPIEIKSEEIEPPRQIRTKKVKEIKKEIEKTKEEDKLKSLMNSEFPEMDEDDIPDMDQMMADIMGGFSSLNKPSKTTKKKKQKLPFVPSLEVKTSREIIRELDEAIDRNDKALQLSLLKGLEEHTEMKKEDRIKYFTQEASLAIELGHDETAAFASENLLKLDPYNITGNYNYLLVSICHNS